MKKVLIAAAAYAALGAAAELAYVAAVNRRHKGLSLRFDVSTMLLWPALAYNVAAGKSLLSVLPGVEPAPPTATGAVPFNATNRPVAPASAGAIVAPAEDSLASVGAAVPWTPFKF